MPSASSGLVRLVAMATTWILGKGRPEQQNLLNHCMYTPYVCSEVNTFLGDCMWPPEAAVQGKGEGKGSLCRPSQETLVLLRPLTQGALSSTALVAFPSQNTQGFCFQLPDPHTRCKPGKNTDMGQKAFINHLFIHSSTRYLFLAHDTPVTD